MRHTRMVSHREFRGFFVSRWDHRERQGRDALLAAPSTLFRGPKEAGYFRTRMGRGGRRSVARAVNRNPAGDRKLDLARNRTTSTTRAAVEGHKPPQAE